MWQIRPFQEQDQPALLQLFERVFGRALSSEAYRWKLRSHGLPVENVYVAVDGDRPIFHYAGIPIQYEIAGEVRLGMVSVDTMASPDYRRQGLLTTVGKYTYDRWREQGVDFVIGLPNEQWGSRATALGWQPLFPLAWYSFPLRPSQIMGRKMPLAAKFRIADQLWRMRWWRNVSTAITPQTELLTDSLRIVNEALIAPQHNSTWFNWRYLQCPTPYQLLTAENGIIAYRIESTAQNHTGIIAECSGEHRPALLQLALQKMYAAGAVSATTQAVVGSDFARELTKIGFRRRPHSFGVQIVPLSDDLPALHERQNPQNWDFCGGDFDII